MSGSKNSASSTAFPNLFFCGCLHSKKFQYFLSRIVSINESDWIQLMAVLMILQPFTILLIMGIFLKLIIFIFSLIFFSMCSLFSLFFYIIYIKNGTVKMRICG